jgi:hypothetical protein
VYRTEPTTTVEEQRCNRFPSITVKNFANTLCVMRVEAADAVEFFGAHGLPVGAANVTAKPGKRHRQPLYNTGKAFDAHQRHVAQAAAAEQRQRHHDAVRKSMQQRATKQLFTTQQHNNYMREEQLGTTLREQPATAQNKHGSPVRRPRSAPATKDWRYYRRQGFIWTDLYHTSQSSESRMRTVVQPQFIERDRDFLNSLIATVQREDEVAAAEAAEHLEMVAKQREQFKLKQQRSRARQAQLQGGVSAALNMCTSTSTLKLDRTRSLSPGLTELAQPKKQFSKSRVLLTAGHSDMKGLLCTDPALVDVMPWHLQHEPRQLAAEQRLTKQRVRTATTTNCSSSKQQQQQRPHSAAAAVAYRHTMYAKSSTEKHLNSDVETCSQSSSDTDNISYWMSRT